MVNPDLATTVTEVRAHVARWRRERARIALVPTMGALHEGHLALVREARTRVDRVVVSIFVNPAQFAPHEDFDRYPRTLDADLDRLGGAADLVYAPDVRDMYPAGFATKIMMDGPADGLESIFRPHFFGGVATVVAKLLLQCRPDVAMFGEKDYQQLLVVRRMVRDLDMALDIAGVPISREADGLALSSRNAYLTQEQRAVAPALNRVIASVAARVRGGAPILETEAEGTAELLNAGFERVDYVAVRDAETLHAIRQIERPARVLAAAWLGTTRLIDNWPV